MQFSWMSRSHRKWKQAQKVTFKTKLMEAFPNNPNVDGWGARKCKSQFAGPRIPMSMVTTYLTYSSFGMHNKDAHNSVDSVNAVPQHETCHGVGWKRESLVRAIQVPWKPIIYVGCTTLYYVDGQQVESIGTSPWCIIYDGHHGPSALKTPWKLMLIYSSGVDFFHWRSAGIPRIIYTHNAQVQRQLGPLSRATKTSVFFMAPTQLWCLGQGIRGMHQL